jgi:hypothetical protein
MRGQFGLVMLLGALVLGGTATERLAFARGAKATKAAAAGAKEVNACGCYKDTAGACFCGKKGKCACPGDCEPKGCEDKRAAQMKKEIAAETKKAALADKKQREKSRASAQKAARPKRKPGNPDGLGQ